MAVKFMRIRQWMRAPLLAASLVAVAGIALAQDYRTGHPRILPKPYFSGLEVLSGGYGAGTVFRTTVTNQRNETVAVVDQKMMFR